MRAYLEYAGIGVSCVVVFLFFFYMEGIAKWLTPDPKAISSDTIIILMLAYIIVFKK